jgi:hypothetical protein
VVPALDADEHANLAYRFLDKHVDFLRFASDPIRNHGGFGDDGAVVQLSVK